MSPFELILSIKDGYCEGDVKEAVEHVNELIKQIESNPRQLNYDLSEAIQDFTDIYKICPLCGSDIIQLDTYEESRGEYQGTPVNETINTYGCENSNCGYIVGQD